jgi:ATP-dependent RNA helicase DeaD
MTTFQELGLRDEVLQAVADLGFETPSEIQIKAIPHLLAEQGNDFIGLAQTGTGKTAGFGLPLAHLLDFSITKTQALIVCPTRELCLQITQDIKKFTKNFRGANVVPVYGGASFDIQKKQLNRGAQIVVATPGRLIDFLKRKSLDISQVSYVVLDEADEMLNMGFKEDIDSILSFTPDTKDTWMFSATMSKEVANIASKFMDNPAKVTVGRKNSSASTIEHQYYILDDRDKFTGLKRLLDFYPNIYGVVFCQTRMQTKAVADHLMKHGYNSDALHGDLSQAQRDSVMKRFRDNTIQILVATDVAARGIDVDDLTHVIHFSLPDDVENYTHRSGRTGRAGKSGISMALANPGDGWKIREIEKIMQREITLTKIPDGREICERQLLKLVNQVKNVKVDHAELDQYMGGIFDIFAELSKEEVIELFVSNEFNRFLEFYKNSRDINKEFGRKGARNSSRPDRDRGERSSSGGSRRASDDNFTRLFINVGELDKMDKGGILRMLCDNTNVPGSAVGRIDLKREFSFVEVENQHAEQVRKSLDGNKIEGRDLKVEFSKEERSAGGGGGSRRPSGGGGGGGYKGKSSFRDRGESNRGGSGGGGGSRRRK